MRKLSLLVGCLLCGAASFAFAQEKTHDSARAVVDLLLEQTASESAAEGAREVAVKRGIEWLASRQCATCHFKVPGKVESVAFSPEGNLIAKGYAPAAEIASAKAPHPCTRAAENQELVTYLGVSLAAVPAVVRHHVKLPAKTGLLVETVDVGSPAEKAGLARNDLLLKIDEQVLVNPEQFTVLIRTFPNDAEVRLTTVQQNEPRVLRARLAQRKVASTVGKFTEVDMRVWSAETGEELKLPRMKAAHYLANLYLDVEDKPLETKPATPPRKKTIAYLGIHTADVPEALARQLRLPAGVGRMIESVEPDTGAARAGLAPFDVLHKLDDQILVNSDQFTVLIRSHKPGDEVKLTLIREGQRQVHAVVLGKHEIDPEPGDLLGELSGTREKWVTTRLSREYLNAAQLLLRENVVLSSDTAVPAEDDATFIRRSYLDLVGELPPADAVKTFVDDQGKDKRKRLIDSLLARPEVVSRASGSTAVKWSDPIHQLSFVSKDGARHLTVTNASGKILFEGPVDTADQRKVLPVELAGKLEVILNTETSRAPQPVSAQDILSRPLPRLELVDVPFMRACDQLRDLWGVNLVVNSKALKQAGVSADEPISLSLRDVRLSTALSTLLSLAGNEKARLGYTVDGEVILISVKEK